MARTVEEYLQTSISEPLKIGEGRYREVFRNGNMALKLLKPVVRKDYCLFHINFPADLYTKYKFGIIDFNQFEYEGYQEFIERVPSELRDKFSHIHLVGKFNGRSASISDIVFDSYGNPAKSLAQHGQVNNPRFWGQIKKLEDLFKQEKIFLMDIRGENIMVKDSNGEPSPVIIDFKRYGRRTYPFQIWLSSEQELIKKMTRRFQRLREQYQQS